MSNHKSLQMLVVLLLLLLASIAHLASASSDPIITPAAVDTIRYPIDLYFIADFSSSMTKNDRTRVKNFINSLRGRMSQLAGGYYQNDTDIGDGLRVSVVAFGCNGKETNGNSKPWTIHFVAGPTGDEATIKAGMQELAKQKAMRGTCPSGGLNMVLKEINATRQTQEARPSAVVLLTDGAIWKNDFKKSNNTATAIRSQEDVFFFGINYGNNAQGSADLRTLVANRSHIFGSSDLEEVADMLSILMLGRYSAEFLPTPEQRQRASNYTVSNNGTTLCLGENGIPLALYGRAINLFALNALLCEFTREETNQTFIVNPVKRNAQVFCDVPASLERKPMGNNQFTQNFRVKVDSRRNGPRNNLFSVSRLSINVVLCMDVNFKGNSPVGEDNCFPAETPQNSSFGSLEISGPTVNEPTSKFYCKFDNEDRIQAVRRPDGILECAAPAVDIEGALLAGKDPTPFSQFRVETEARGILLNSEIDQTTFTPVSCIATLNDTKSETFCWNSDEVVTMPHFGGKSLSNLIGNFGNLEFSCLYQYNGVSVPVAAELIEGNVVKCAPPPLKNFFADAFPLDDDLRLFNVSIRVRSSQGSSDRNWWSMKKDTAFPVTVSSCLDAFVQTSTICMGESLSISFGGNGIGNFFKSRPARCNFRSASGELLQSNNVINGEACTFESVSPRLATVEVREIAGGNNALVMKTVAVSSETVVPCFEFDDNNDTDANITVCWGKDIRDENVIISGKSLAFYRTGAGGSPLPQCKFSLEDGGSTTSSAKRGTVENTLECAFPAAWGLRQLPFKSDFTVSLLDSRENLTIEDPRRDRALTLRSCVKRSRTALEARDRGKALPECAPDCCLRRQAEIKFTGDASEDIAKCVWVAANGTELATTVPQNATDGNGMLCVVPDWAPPSPAQYFPAVKVYAYPKNTENDASFVIGEADLDNRTTCVYPAYSTKKVTFGSDLQVTFGGPTVRDVLNLFTIKCALKMNGELKKLVNAAVDENGFTCTLSKLYDSLVGADLGLFLFPLEIPSNDNNSTEVVPAGGDAHIRSHLRRRRILQTNTTTNSTVDPLAGGVELHSQQLTEIDVSSQMVSLVAPGDCVSAALNLTFTGPGATVLQDQVNCSFELTDANATTTWVTVLASFDNSTNELKCGVAAFTPDSVNVTYNASITRSDNNESLTLLSGSRLSCLVAPVPTDPPTAPAATSDALSAGAIAGIVVACLALILLLVAAAIYDRHKKEQRRKKRRDEAAAAAAAAAARDRQEKDPESNPRGGDVPQSDAVSEASAKTSPAASQRPVASDEDPVFLVVTPPSPKEMVTVSATPRKYNIGDCVQVMDAIEEMWRYTFVRGFAPNNEYFVEDERLSVPESRIRWPTYSPGEAVEARKTADGPWMPGVVAFVDTDLGTVKLMGGADEHLFSNVRPAPFQIGENVEERGPDHEWRPAVVVSCEPDGTYVVDGAGGLGLNRTRKRLRYPQYHGGDIVEVRNVDTGDWNRATVVTTEGGVVVALEDGRVDPKRFQNMDVRRPLNTKSAAFDVSTMSVVTSLEGADDGGEEMESPRRKFKRREPIDFHELPDFCFEITVDKSQGMGVRFGWTRDQQIVVQKFLGLPGMDAGPLEASECLNLGDQLLAVNGVSVGGRSFAEVTDMIRTSPDRITLKFGRWRETVKLKISAPSFLSPASGRKSTAGGATSENAQKVDLSLV